MKVLIVGSGGREHAICWKVAQSPLVEKIFCAPGNLGMAQVAECLNAKNGLFNFALEEKIDLTIVGPEDPLVHGIVNEFMDAGLKIFGPTKEAAILEGSKVFTKHFLAEHEIPTAPFSVFSSTESIREHIRVFTKIPDRFPLVIKVNGLAAGKGVRVCMTQQNVYDFLKEIDKGKFKDADNLIIVEDFLEGEETSYIVMVDKNGNVLPLASSQDHKRVGDGDTGLNTGGMGAYSPAPVVTPEVEEKILERIIYPTVGAMKKAEKPYCGFLYAGLMIKNGDPYVLEYNVRLGDPETQPILVRMKSDLVELILAALDGDLRTRNIEWDPQPAVCNVMASEGYPESFTKGAVISNIEDAEKSGAVVFHAGTALNEKGQVVTAGGRVLGITAKGKDYAEAQKNSYEALGKIHCDKLFWRTDIAKRAVEWERRK